MSFWLFSLWACIWQLTKPKASTGILLWVCWILSSFSPSKLCACLLSLPEQPCICIPCLLFEKKRLCWHKLGGFFRLMWLLEQAAFWWGAVPDAEDLHWPHLNLAKRWWEWLCSASSSFYFCGLLSQGQEQGPALVLSRLLTSLFWLSHDKLGRWGNCLGYSASFMHWYLGWLRQVSNLLVALVRGRVQRFDSVWITRQLNDFYFLLLKVEAAPVQWHPVITAASSNVLSVAVCKCSSDLIRWKTWLISEIC